MESSCITIEASCVVIEASCVVRKVTTHSLKIYVATTVKGGFEQTPSNPPAYGPVYIKTQSSVSASKKTKKTCGTQVCYLLVLQSCQIQPSLSPKLLSQFLPNLYIFCVTYTLLLISNLKEIASAVLEIFVPKNYLIFFTFSSPSHKITNTFKSHITFPCFNFFQILKTYKTY